MIIESSSQALRPTTAVGFRQRAAAYGGDVVVLWVLVMLMGLMGPNLISAALAPLGYQLYFVRMPEYAYGLRFLDIFLTSCGYFVLCEWLFGATVGKWILGMRVVKLNGQPCSLIAALVRGIVRWIEVFLLSLPAYLSMRRNPELQQRLGDRAARTVVVSYRDPFIRRTRVAWRLPAALVAFLALKLVWQFTFLLWSGQNWLGPPYLPVKVSARSANLESADFSPAMTLSEEYGLADFSGFEGTDINERLFAA